MIYELHFDSPKVIGYRGVGSLKQSEIDYVFKSIFHHLSSSVELSLYLDLTYVTQFDPSATLVLRIYQILYPHRTRKLEKIVVISGTRSQRLEEICYSETEIEVFDPENRWAALGYLIN